MEFYNVLTKENQSLIDIAMSEYGHADGVFFLLEDNPEVITSLTDELEPGTLLNIRKSPDVPNLKRLEFVRDGKELAVIKLVEKPVYITSEFNFEALAGTRDVFTFRVPQDSSVSSIEGIENIESLSVQINKHVYNMWSQYNQIFEDAPEGEFTVRKNDSIIVNFTRANNDLTAKVKINLSAKPKTVVKQSVVRGGVGRWLVVLNFVSQTVSLIDTTMLAASNYAGAGVWTGLTVLNFIIPAGTYVFSRIIYNPEQNCFDLFSRDSVTRFVVDDAIPANSKFYDQSLTTVNGKTFYPTVLAAEICAVEFIPSNQDMSAKYFLSQNTNAYGTIVCDANDVSFSDNFVDSWSSWIIAGRLSYLADLDILVGSSSDAYAIYINPRTRLDASTPFNPFYPTHNQPYSPQATFSIIGASDRLANIGAAKYYHKRGWILLQCESGIMQVDPTTFRSFRTPQIPNGTKFCKFCLVDGGDPYDVYFAGSNTTNSIYIGWATAIESEQNFAPYLPYSITKGVPSVNELGTRDLIHCPTSNVIVAQGMKNGNQTTGVDRIHVIDVATKAYVGYITVGNMDARSSTNANFGNQIAIDYYDN